MRDFIEKCLDFIEKCSRNRETEIKARLPRNVCDGNRKIRIVNELENGLVPDLEYVESYFYLVAIMSPNVK